MDDINDELFRRAADNYPLKTDTPDWDAVLNKINTAGPADDTDPVPKKRNKNYRYLLLLLLLIPFAVYENRNSRNDNNNDGKIKNITTTETGKSQAANPNPVTEGSNKITDSKTETVNPENQDNAEVLQNTDNKNIVQNKIPVPVNPAETQPNKKTTAADINTTSTTRNKTTAVEIDNTNNNSVAAKYNKANSSSSKQRLKIKIKNAGLATADENNNGSAAAKQNRKKKLAAKSSAAITLTSPEAENDVALTKDAVAGNEKKITAEKEISETATKEAEPDKKNKLDSAVTPKVKEKEVAKTEDKNPTKEEKKKKERTKHFYVGLVAGPDFSAIKLQSLKKVGINYGFLIGYKLSKKFSIEAGLLQDKKYYSTDGKYFSTKNIWLPPTETIDHVDGICKMLELPVNVTYTFRERKKSSLFGSVGFSSYFMQHETYRYELNYGGYRYPKNYNYKNRSTSLFAMVNISAGYTYSIGKIGSLRIEPFIKLPVNKIGTGELPIQSGGIFIGFTKLIF